MQEPEPFDATAKNFFCHWFQQQGLQVETEREVFQNARRIDLVVTCKPEDKPKLAESVFCHFRELNALELKGFSDPLNLQDFNRIMMRAWGLGALEFADAEFIPSRLPTQRTVTIVCVRRPNKILDYYQSDLRFEATQRAGIYSADNYPEVLIIHPTELDLIPENYPLLTLARGEKLKTFIDLCLIEGLNHYLQLIVDVGMVSDPNVIWHKIMEATKMKQMIHEDTWPLINQFFRETPDSMKKLEVYNENVEEERQKARDEGKLEHARKSLIMLLKFRFEKLPDNVINRIHAITDIEKLDAYCEQVLKAENLSEFDLFLN